MRRSPNPGKQSGGEGAIAARAADSIDAIVQRGAEAYDRFRHLPRVLPVDGAELADPSPAGRRSTVARLARALRAERNRGRAGHWTYDLNRHIALAQAYQAERRLLVEKPPR
jgi:hypothetical protein